MARISLCVLTLQSAHMTVLATKHDSYSITVPEASQKNIMTVQEGEVLYVTEHYNTHGAKLELFLPEGVAVEYDLFGTAQVIVNRVSQPVRVAMSGESTLCLQEGMCPKLTMHLEGHSTLVGPELMVGEADCIAQDETDIVLQHVRKFLQCELSDGAHMVSGHTIKVSAPRKKRAPLSVVSAYRTAGVLIDDRLNFYAAAAIEQEWRDKGNCEKYEGNPLHSTEWRVEEAHRMMRNNFSEAGSATRICRAIRDVPHSLPVEREVLGAMLCRRLMLCTLEKPIGTGAISPYSLCHAGAVPERESANVKYIWEHMWKSSYSLIERGVCSSFGLFGHFFEHAIRHIKRCRELSPESDWRELFAKVFKNTDAFVTHGRRAWQHA